MAQFLGTKVGGVIACACALYVGDLAVCACLF